MKRFKIICKCRLRGYPHDGRDWRRVVCNARDSKEAYHFLCQHWQDISNVHIWPL